MIEVRTYTLASMQSLERYADVHWARHIPSLAKYGITTLHIWQETLGAQPRLIAVVKYATGVDPKAATAAFMDSSEFMADMDGFPMDDILNVQSIYVKPGVKDPQQES